MNTTRDPHADLPGVTDTPHWAFMNGYQALLQLLLIQHTRDHDLGLHTAGFVSGYRGSPLGGLDQTLQRASDILARHDIVFQPGVNEDLAATAVWGSQQLGFSPGRRYDGVFSLWYGKGPGVDRSADVLRHANAAGSAAHGGVLVVAGDDHAAKSSTLPHQTDHLFKAVMMPVLAPSGIQEYLDLGVHGFALSRYSGCWVAFKALADTVETSASVEIDAQRVRIKLPEDFALPPGGLNIRWPDPPLQQEARLLQYKLYAALAYCRANALNRLVFASPGARFGIITSGKAYLDVRQALDDLGIDEAVATRIGLRLFKVGMVWPLESEGVRQFAEGLEEILVIEEKRQLIEYQLKEELYNWREDVRPRVIGKFDEKGEWAHLISADGQADHGHWLLPAVGELNPALIAEVIAARLQRHYVSPAISARLELLRNKARQAPATAVQRTPTFCPGCPHNSSTHIPEGSRGLAGIGCHYMVTWMPERRTSTFSQMGGEGVPWVGIAPFTDEGHIFANLGDGTYFHSGLLAIRQAVAAKLNITYKILYNDAVAMTGGQAVDGSLSVPRLIRQLQAEGVSNIVVVTDGSERPYRSADLPHNVEQGQRKELDTIQRRLRETPGVSALIYDQTCAAEKRRRRKRGRYPDPPRFIHIHSAVCEGCGDCGEASSCVSLQPLETPFGRKRRIDQSSCNKDYSCLRGQCPSFVTVEGARLRHDRGQKLATEFVGTLPEPNRPSSAQPYNILVTGVGGTGIVTIGALIGMAAHLDGKGVTVLDMTGLAQKGGSVFSHVRIADTPASLHAVRIAAGEADALIGGDLVVSASTETLLRLASRRTRGVVSLAETPTADFLHDPDWCFPLTGMQAALARASSADAIDYCDAQALATALLGEELTSNVLLLGFAWQRGLLPVSQNSLEEAIRINGAAVALNLAAFEWGRRAAVDLPQVERLAGLRHTVPELTDEALIEQFAEELNAYQNAALAERFRSLLTRVHAAEAALGAQAGTQSLTRLVARHYYHLLAYKDEYEVARLYSQPAFREEIDRTFEGDYRISLHLSPPGLRARRAADGRLSKHRYGAWIFHLMRLLQHGKHLRGTRWDLFGYSAERRLERQLIRDYEVDINAILEQLSFLRRPLAALLLSWPEEVRGFGPVKADGITRAQATRARLWQQWHAQAVERMGKAA